MKIGFFTDSYLPRLSGVVRAVEAAATGLRRRGHRVCVFAPAYPGHVDTDPDVYRFPSIPAPGHADFPLAVPFSGAHLRTLRELDLDVVHTHSPFLLGGLGVWAARTLKRPLVFTYHTLYAEYAHYAPVVGEWIRPFLTAYTATYCNRCDLVLVSVSSMVAVLRGSGVQTRIEVTPSVGFNPAEFGRASPGWVRAEFGIPAGAPLLLCVARLAREKGLGLLLDAFAGLAEPARLLLLGDGPERETLEGRARRLGVAERVVFGGSQDHARVVDALVACDLFVFPSQTETLGLAVIEAMAAGRAVVAVRGGAMPDIVRDGETGRLVAPDPAALREAVSALLADPAQRAAMGARAGAAAAAYTQDRVTDGLVRAYEELRDRSSANRYSREETACT